MFVHAEGLSFKTVLPEDRRAPGRSGKAKSAGKAYQGRIAPERLVFIDETWVKTNMASARLGPRGRRL